MLEEHCSVVDGIGGTVKRMVYQDVMAGKRCRNAKDFVYLIQQKNSSIISDELLKSEIQHGYKDLQLLFNDAKAVPDTQKIHSMMVIDVNKIECKIYSLSTQKTVVHF